MLRRDYIMRLMQQFFEALEKLLEDRKRKPATEIQMKIKGLYEAYFHRSSAFFIENSGEDIVKYLLQEFYNLPDAAEETDIRQARNDMLSRIGMLAELLYQDSRLCQDTESDKAVMRENALYLFAYIDKNSNTFSFERRERIAELTK